ncbi:NusG domain II-containing protein [uncultured Dubosiella sp.]|uniref:NusG domain II-containing protein n=1 Tax=uncultured Dubosiella sp. TaxID=1937011 RepID=UPI00273131A6|nr:NusG domain II-containing protein [uncultured Dubosiella sp.]
MDRKLTMTKGDRILIVCIMLVAIGLIVPIFFMAPDSTVAVVQVRNEEQLRISLLKDGKYSVDGTLGKVHIEVKDGAVRVEQENSPHHYCSRQGFVDSPNTPIVCLPNETGVTIEGEQAGEDVQIQ